MDFKLFVLNACVLLWTFRVQYISSANCSTVFPGVPTFQNCAYRCHCKNNAQCDEQTGSCDNGCKFSWMGPGCQYRNIAQFNTKTQNVRGASDPADYAPMAVDGDVTTCARTSTAGADSNYRSYWRIEWEKEYQIVGLVIKISSNEIDDYNRFRVETGTGTNNGDFNNICYQHDDIPGTTEMEIMCRQPVRTKHLRIILDKQNTTLRVCEVEIYGGRDVAFNKPTSQKTTEWDASHAVDGRPHIGGDWTGDVCSNTGYTHYPYWQVDFEAEYVVQSVYFYGSLNNNGQYSGFQMKLINKTDETIIFYKDSGNGAASQYQPKIVDLTNQYTARYLQVTRPYQSTSLVICEIAAFAECPLHKCGWNCDTDCHCANQTTGTYQMEGKCPNGCAERWTGENKICDIECDAMSWGRECQYKCGNCYQEESCNFITGHCDNGCSGPWYTPECKQECTNHTYGMNCLNSCGQCKDNLQCNITTGQCEQGCEIGWQLPLCQQACAFGSYGDDCTKKCGHCLQGVTCNSVTGVCENGCDPWFLRPYCNESIDVLYNLRDNITMTMSSVYNGMVPDYATNHLNGIRDPETCKCCSITTYAQSSWWKVDLHNTYPLKEMHVYASENDRFSNQLSGFSVYLANDSKEEAKLVFSDTSNINEDNDHFVIQLSNRLGRIVTIQRFGTLAVCNMSLIQGECSTGYFGPHCTDVCHCADGAPCNRNNGNCQSPVCKLGWTGPACKTECPIHRFGEGCKNECFCKEGTCTKDYGICNGVCQAGYRGAQCNEACLPGTFGESCTQMCHCRNTTCSADDGLCPGDCIDGYEGQKCNKKSPLKSAEKDNTMAIGIGVGVGAFVLIVILSVVIYRYRIYKREQYIKENYVSTDNRNASPEEQVYDSIDTDIDTNEARQGETNM